MSKWQLIIDVAKCEDCNNCILACKDEHVDNEFPGYSAPQPLHGQYWMNIDARERGQYPRIDVAYLPQPCMHCANPPCVKAAQDGAMSIRADGLVMLDPNKAKGQKQLVEACPYGAVFWNQELDLPQKCTMCAHLLDNGWSTTRCVQACPTGALQLIKRQDAEMQAQAEKQGLQTLRPKLNSKPRVYYQNLHRYEKCFISGSVAGLVNGVTECLTGAKVELKAPDGTIMYKVESDFFGDFKLDGLDPHSGPYSLSISMPGYAAP